MESEEEEEGCGEWDEFRGGGGNLYHWSCGCYHEPKRYKVVAQKEICFRLEASPTLCSVTVDVTVVV